MTADYRTPVSRGHAWVAADDERVVGLAILIPQDDHLLLENMAVLPQAQGLGIGASLLALAEQVAGRRRLTQIRLYTNEAMTENLAYYPRHGYRPTHRAVQDGFQRVYFIKDLAADRPVPGPGSAT